VAELPVNADLLAYRGDTWSQTFRFSRSGQPVDLTGATVEAWAASSEGITIDLVVSVNGPEGLVTIAFPANTIVPAGKYGYDVEVTATDGTVTTWVRGQITVRPDVTNAPATAPAEVPANVA
jgi:hypothetical protein